MPGAETAGESADESEDMESEADTKATESLQDATGKKSSSSACHDVTANAAAAGKGKAKTSIEVKAESRVDSRVKTRGRRAKNATKKLAKEAAPRTAKSKQQKSAAPHSVASTSPGEARLTDRQSQVLEVVKQHIDVHGLPPTRADIARELGFRSANAAEEHLRALARKGVIEIVPGASRGIRLPEEGGLPIVGRVAAGEPILAIEHVEDRCAVDPSLFHPRADFLLRVQGESMVNVGIHDGDLLAVHRTQTADNGAIVVARVDDEVTVKRLKVKPGKSELELVPENDSMSSIIVDLATTPFTIEGISVGIIRNRM